MSRIRKKEMAWNRTGSSDGIVYCGIRYGNYDRFCNRQ